MKTRLQKYLGPIADAALFGAKVILVAAAAVAIVAIAAALSLAVPFALGYTGALAAGAVNPLAWGVGFAGAVALLRVLGSAIRGEYL